MNKEISTKTFIISITTVIVVLLLVICGFMIHLGVISLGPKVIDDFWVIDDFCYYTPPEGTIKNTGIVVKAENGKAYIMPIIENPIILQPEKNEENKTYYSTNYYTYSDNQFDLKRGQKVTVTYHYEKDEKSAHSYNAIVEDIEIVKEKSDIEIPRDIVLDVYSSRDKVTIELNEKESNNQKIVFTITDKNEYKYDYSTMRYILRDMNKMAFLELPKISNVRNEKEFKIGEDGKLDINLDWSKVYGNLKEGNYRLDFLTVNSPRKSVIDPDVMEYPNAGVIITIDFTIKSNGNMKVTYLGIN